MKDNIDKWRSDFEKLGTLYERSPNVTIHREVIEDVTCYWFKPLTSVKPNRQIIYLHGGCFILGSIASHQALVSHLAEYFSLPILFVEYSLAPEKPFPTAVNEVEKVYRHILSTNPDNEIILMGDSAGGGLAISILSRFDKVTIRPPIYLVMISPWVDLSCTNASLLNNKDLDPILTKEALQQYASMYADGNKLSEANPIENVTGEYPPALILVGAGEILLDDSKSIYNRIASRQKKSRLSIYDNQNHVWPLGDINSEASKKALEEIKGFIAG